MTNPEDGWSEYRRLVLTQLDSLKGRLDRLDRKVDRLRVDIATLRGHAASWGAISEIAELEFYVEELESRVLLDRQDLVKLRAKVKRKHPGQEEMP